MRPSTVCSTLSCFSWVVSFSFSRAESVALICLWGFGLLYIAVRLKTLLLPSGDDSRLLLGLRDTITDLAIPRTH